MHPANPTENIQCPSTLDQGSGVAGFLGGGFQPVWQQSFWTLNPLKTLALQNPRPPTVLSTMLLGPHGGTIQC